MFCTSCIQEVVANAIENDLDIIFCPYCQTQFFSPNDLVQPNRLLRQFLGRLRLNCPHDGCKEQITYDQYHTHIGQCQFKNIICDHCNQEYLRSDKNEHEANCLELIKFNFFELSAKHDESVAELACVRSDLQSTISELENVKRNNSEERQTYETELANVRSELTLVKSQLENDKRTSASLKSQFLNMTRIFPAGFKYFENDVFVTQLKQATTTSFDWKGHHSRNNFDWFRSDSAKEQFTGAKIYVTHQHRVYSKEDFIFLGIERAETTKKIEAIWNTKVFQSGKQLLDRDCEYTYENDLSWGSYVDEKNWDQSSLCVIVTIKKWKVTNK